MVILPCWWLLDRLVPKDRRRWAFFVHPLKSNQFVENARAVYEAAGHAGGIKRVLFIRGCSDLSLNDGDTAEFVDLQSLSGLWHLSRCGVFLITNSVALDMSWRWGSGEFAVLRPSLTRRSVVNLWHGIPLKRLFLAANEGTRLHADRVGYRRKERGKYAGLVASSDVDSYAMAAMFHPIDYPRVWVTGLPRNDFLLAWEPLLPYSLVTQIRTIRALKGARRLITYAPTFRDVTTAGAEYYDFSEAEISQLKELLKKHNAVFGFRMHYFRKGNALFNMEQYLDGEWLIDLGHSRIEEIAPVVRETDLLITDYSSVYIDALYLDKPVFSFAYDLDHYRDAQNGLLYDMDLVFPGPVVSDFSSLLDALDKELQRREQVQSERYRTAQKIFFKYRDSNNSTRLITQVMRTIGVKE